MNQKSWETSMLPVHQINFVRTTMIVIFWSLMDMMQDKGLRQDTDDLANPIFIDRLFMHDTATLGLRNNGRDGEGMDRISKRFVWIFYFSFLSYEEGQKLN